MKKMCNIKNQYYQIQFDMFSKYVTNYLILQLLYMPAWLLLKEYKLNISDFCFKEYN